MPWCISAPEVVRSYLLDTRRVLRNGGHALYHHSNYGAAPGANYAHNPHARNYMTQEIFTEAAAEAGLKVVESVVIGWGYVPDLDCVSLLHRP